MVMWCVIGVVFIVAIVLFVKGATGTNYVKEAYVMHDFDREQCELIAKYTTRSFGDVVRIYYMMCDRSFDATLAYIKAREFN